MKITGEKLKPIHPFAARMAPEIAFEALKGLKKGAIILDPMVGSGTVLRTVSEYGFTGIGFDLDPLAVLMSKVWTVPIDPKILISKAQNVFEEASSLPQNSIYLPWIDDDTRTKEFIRFWFGRKQINSLRKLSFLLDNNKGNYNDALKIAFSRLIISKTTGASLAGDLPHSRPHKVRENNDFDVFAGFLRSCTALSKIVQQQRPAGKVSIKLGDARNLKSVPDAFVSAIITSPPYLNALDYMRGHKFTLVWLGYQIDELTNIRAGSIGAERAPDAKADLDMAQEITKDMRSLQKLPQRKRNMINRYAIDMYSFIKESARVLKRNGRATLVVGNSCMNEIYVENDLIVRNSCQMAGLRLISKTKRKIPPNRRYLPSPSYVNVANFKNRMRTESVMTFSKP